MNKINQTKTLDLDAGHYIKHSSLQNGLAKEILSNCRIDPSAHILDIGCGDGRVTAELSRHAVGGKVLGVDASPCMIEFALKSFPKAKYPNLDFMRKMAEEISFSQEFDLIVSFSCLHWLKDAKKAFCQMESALKKNGELLILTYPQESPYYKYLELALKNYPEYSSLSSNHTMLSIEMYRNVLMENDLEIIDFQKRSLLASYNSIEEIQQYIKGWLNSYVPIPEYLYDSFLKDVTDEIMSDPSCINCGKIEIPYIALIIKARKK